MVLVKVEDDLAVGGRAEAVAFLLEAAAELGVVVDLAVEDQPQALVLVGQGLMAARREVDDAEPGVAQGDAAIAGHQGVLEVGAAVALGRGHGPHPASQLRGRLL